MAEVENAGPAPLDLERELTCSVSEVPMRSGGGARYGGQDECRKAWCCAQRNFGVAQRYRRLCYVPRLVLSARFIE